MSMCSNEKACEANQFALRCKDSANVELAEVTARRIAALESLLREALDYIPTYKGNETGSANFANRVREVLKGKYDD